jgi:hypothetical protein
VKKRFIVGAALALASLVISACNTGGGIAYPNGVPTPFVASPTPSPSPSATST